MAEKRMFFIYNPKAGKAQIKNHLADIVDIFVKGGFDVEIYPTQCQGDAIRAVRDRKKGYDIIINYVQSVDIANELKRELEEKYDIKVLATKADIKSEEEIQNMVEIAIKEFGKIDVLVNNAGIAIDKEFDDRTVEDWKLTLSTNLIGPFIISKLIGNQMVKNKYGKIINISSTNGIDAFFPTSIDYDASKAALINLTHNLAIQFAPYVNVNCIAPGWVNTDMNKELPKDLVKEEISKIYKKRFAEPKEIASVVKFIISDKASYINNSIIRVDGGLKC